jgi:hypothetical protein
MKVVPSQEGAGRRSYRGSGTMKNGCSKGPVCILHISECSRDVSMALGMREIIGHKAITCFLCLDIQTLDNPSLLLAHVNAMRGVFEIVLPCSSLLVSVANVD